MASRNVLMFINFKKEGNSRACNKEYVSSKEKKIWNHENIGKEYVKCERTWEDPKKKDLRNDHKNT